MGNHILSFLVAVLICTASAYQTRAASSVSEDFSGGGLPAGLTQSAGVAATFNGVNATFPGPGDFERSFLQTAGTDYNTVDFTAEVTVTVSNGSGGPGIAFFGLGEGEPDGGFFDEPRIPPHIFIRAAPDDFGGGFADIVDNSTETNNTGAGAVGAGIHRLQLVWDTGLQQLTAAVDQNYAGGPFVADTVIGTVNGADNGFTNLNSRIFFGGSAGTTFDDFSVVVIPEPATAAVGLFVLAGITMKRRRRSA